MPQLNDNDQNRLARKIQGGFPLIRRPFAAIAEELELDPSAVIAQVGEWLESKRMREISAVLEGSAFGNDSALVAGSVPEEDIERIAGIISAHPTVTHNYRREHEFNLWFTISAPPHMDLDRTLEILEAQTGVDKFHALRRTHTFKIGVNFDLDTNKNSTKVEKLEAPPLRDPNAREQAMYRALQTSLSAVEQPFDLLAVQAGVDVEELLEFAQAELGGSIRRYVGTLHHRKVGVRGNGMTVWSVPEDRVEEVGWAMAHAPEVSHCYARNAVPGFPWTLYTMIHGPDGDTVQAVVDRLAKENDVEDGMVLFSTHQYKKCRLRYFQPELESWWSENNGGAA